MNWRTHWWWLRVFVMLHVLLTLTVCDVLPWHHSIHVSWHTFSFVHVLIYVLSLTHVSKQPTLWEQKSIMHYLKYVSSKQNKCSLYKLLQMDTYLHDSTDPGKLWEMNTVRFCIEIWMQTCGCFSVWGSHILCRRHTEPAQDEIFLSRNLCPCHSYALLWVILAFYSRSCRQIIDCPKSHYSTIISVCCYDSSRQSVQLD